MTKPIKSAAALTLAVSILLTLTGCSGKPDAVPTPTAAVQETPTPTPEPTPEPTAAPAPTPEPTATPNPNIPVITVVEASEEKAQWPYRGVSDISCLDIGRG